jgi:hypothetical protein
MGVTEEEIRRLLDLDGVPVERRMQARAAMTGSVSDLLDRVRSVGAVSISDWQASLSVLYMVDFAARHRPPEQVAAMSDELRGDHHEDVVLDAAAARPPRELTAIAAELHGSPAARAGSAAGSTAHRTDLAESFLSSVAARRQPTDLATMLVEMRDDAWLMLAAVGRLCSSARPAKVAQVVLHLRGLRAQEPLTEILTAMRAQADSANLAAFLTGLERFRDTESVHAVIGDVVAWNAPPSTAPEAKTGVGRTAELVKSLLERKEPDLAKLVVTSAIKDFARSGQQYRLYALVFVFIQHELDNAAEQIMDEISATARPEDVVEMIIKYCENEEPQHTVTLLRVILENPKPGVTVTAAVEFAKTLDRVRSDIFATVAAWAYENLSEFEQGLRGNSNDWAEEFRDAVARSAFDRDDGGDIGNIVLWLLSDLVDSKRGKRRANDVVAKVVARRRPDLMVALISKLRAAKGWWTLRDAAAARISDTYGIADMVGLVAAAEGRCLPAVLRLMPDWLTRRQRTDPDVVQLVRKLRAARCNSHELEDALTWSAQHFIRPDGTDPMRALENAGLMVERNAWSKAKWRTRPWGFGFPRHDPDPPQ